MTNAKLDTFRQNFQLAVHLRGLRELRRFEQQLRGIDAWEFCAHCGPQLLSAETWAPLNCKCSNKTWSWCPAHGKKPT